MKELRNVYILMICEWVWLRAPDPGQWKYAEASEQEMT